MSKSNVLPMNQMSRNSDRRCPNRDLDTALRQSLRALTARIQQAGEGYKPTKEDVELIKAGTAYEGMRARRGEQAPGAGWSSIGDTDPEDGEGHESEEESDDE